ncbi:hypothetical protein GCM10027615_69230 [Plantactinospora veratri]
MAQPTTPDTPTPPDVGGAVPTVGSTPAEDATLLERALFEVKRVIVGQDRMVERMFVALLARGHCLLEGVPGVAKTLAVETLARVVGGTFARVQFTPDLVPADIVGTRIYRQSSEKFDVELGPVFVNFLLADEVNRAPAKVQSALLEVMSEQQVSIGGQTHRVPNPFLVMATQNPIEQEGVYPLPEAQRDRFLMKILVGYPTDAEEREIVYRMGVSPPSRRRSSPRSNSSACNRRPTRSSCTTPWSTTPYAWCWRPGLRPSTGCRTWPSSSSTVPARAPRSASSGPPGHSPCCAAATTRCRRTSRTSPRTSSGTGWCSAMTRWPTTSPPTTWSTG